MGDGDKPPLKKEENNNPIKEEILEEEGKKLSRDMARKYIYVRNKERYPLPFEEYKLYHIDGKLFNDSVENLYLCTKEQRNALYAEQIKRGRPFSSAKEIDIFLQNIGKTSPEISKDKRIYEKADTRIPLYWRQRETRKKQIPIVEDPHPELREKIVNDIREAEDIIEEKSEESKFYSIPPRRHPELREKLIDEIREAENKQKGIYRRRRITIPEKIIILIGVLAIIGILILIIRDSQSSKYEEITGGEFNFSNAKIAKMSASEQLFNYEIRTEKYFILVINNKDEDLNLEINYTRHSKDLDINENKTIKVYAPANEETLIEDPGFSRDLGCIEHDCTVNIISSERIE